VELIAPVRILLEKLWSVKEEETLDAIRLGEPKDEDPVSLSMVT
jgi:hypothetical protein